MNNSHSLASFKRVRQAVLRGRYLAGHERQHPRPRRERPVWKDGLIGIFTPQHGYRRVLHKSHVLAPLRAAARRNGVLVADLRHGAFRGERNAVDALRNGGLGHPIELCIRERHVLGRYSAHAVHEPYWDVKRVANRVELDAAPAPIARHR